MCGTSNDIIGISLLAPCTFRLRLKKGSSWDRISLQANPRSASRCSARVAMGMAARASLHWRGIRRFEKLLALPLFVRLIYLFVHRFDVLRGQFLSTVSPDHCALAFFD